MRVEGVEIFMRTGIAMWNKRKESSNERKVTVTEGRGGGEQGWKASSGYQQRLADS